MSSVVIKYTFNGHMYIVKNLSNWYSKSNMFRDQVLFEQFWLSLLVTPYFAKDDINYFLIYQS